MHHSPTSIHESKSPAENSTVKLELDKSEALQAIQKTVQTICHTLIANSSNNSHLLFQLKQLITALTIDALPIQELLSRPDLKKNATIWEKILLDEKWYNIEVEKISYLPLFVAKKLAANPLDKLNLNSLSDISPETADALSAFQGGHLYLNRLTEISSEVAQALAKYKNVLHLEGLTIIDSTVARHFSKRKDKLVLNRHLELNHQVRKILKGRQVRIIEESDDDGYEYY